MPGLMMMTTILCVQIPRYPAYDDIVNVPWNRPFSSSSDYNFSIAPSATMKPNMSYTLLTDLPNEIVFQILTYLPPTSIPTLQQVSQRFNELSQPLLWRYYCRSQFRYWNEHHNIHEKFVDDVTKVDWKKVFSERHSIDQATSTQLNSILSSQTCRIEKAEKIVRYGYDAKDSLVRHLRVDNDAEDVLARRYGYWGQNAGYSELMLDGRYYSDAILGFLHRKMAIQEWVRLKDGQPVPLEKALTAYDMLVLHDRKGDFNDVSGFFVWRAGCRRIG